MERRRTERTKSLLRAQIIFNNRASTIDCIIKNVSPLGARLVLGDAVSIPNEFELAVPQKGRNYRARMIWRDTDSIGVEFVMPATAGHDDPDNRVAALELQNAELKAKVRDLSKRLADLGQDPDIAA